MNVGVLAEIGVAIGTENRCTGPEYITEPHCEFCGSTEGLHKLGKKSVCCACVYGLRCLAF